MLVTKRDGTTQPLDLDKIHAVLEWACNGDPANDLPPIKGVSISEIEMKAQLNFHDKIRTKDIHACLINAAEILISEDTPNYDHAAARLQWFSARKEAFGQNNPPPVLDVVRMNIDRGVYDPDILGMYSEEEWATINTFVDHKRDDLFRYAGTCPMISKYLVQNRKTKQIYESFQFPYILIAAILFNTYPAKTRLGYVKRYYDQISQHYISLPTPIMAGLRTRVKQFSSCTKIESGDSLKSITATATAIVNYAANKAGIGVNIGQIRGEHQVVRNGDAVSTGVIPFAKFFAAALKSCSQGAVRGASATFNYPGWHIEYEKLIELKNNKGTEETRLRNVDYCVHLNKTLFERLVNKGNITLFSPEEVPDLYKAFYGPADKFKTLYERYEKDKTKAKKTLPAVDFFTKFVNERFDTSRIYPFFADNVNEQSPFYEPVKMTNLCVEVMLPTEPMGDDDARLALCTLSAINQGKIKTQAQHAEACEMSVRGLEEVLDYQDYPNEAARVATMEYRPLGIGVIGFAHMLAKNGVTWGSDAAKELVEERIEEMAYYLTKTSIQLAKEKGKTKRTKYHDGWLPMDAAKVRPKNKKDWSKVREDLKIWGTRHATLMAGMPSETSSLIANETNGFEAPKGLVTVKGNKDELMAQVVPEFGKLAHAYETAWDVTVENYLETLSVVQIYFDQAISANTSYVPSRDKITTSLLIKHLIMAYKLGFKTLYYSNVKDGAGDDADDCESGACKI